MLMKKNGDVVQGLVVNYGKKKLEKDQTQNWERNPRCAAK